MICSAFFLSSIMLSIFLLNIMRYTIVIILIPNYASLCGAYSCRGHNKTDWSERTFEHLSRRSSKFSKILFLTSKNISIITYLSRQSNLTNGLAAQTPPAQFPMIV
jgi:hypothetical protein